jgi:alpha-L-arabinofuranosidase
MDNVVILNVPGAAVGQSAHSGLFGGNVLAPRSSMTGENGYATAISDLGVSTLRYPGGSLTEYSFDITRPDDAITTDSQTGQSTDFIPLSEFMNYAASTGHSVNIVIPTRTSFGTEMDDNGDRIPEFNHEELKTFVTDVVAGKYGSAKVVSFEFGNEYWGSGEMTASEYGSLVNEMTGVVSDALGESDVAGASDVKILVQIGYNFGSSSLTSQYEGMSSTDIIADVEHTYGVDLDSKLAVFGSGSMNWTYINNEIIIGQIDSESMAQIDGIVPHVYTTSESSRYFSFDTISNTWLQENPDLEIHVTEWNQKGSENPDEGGDFGLFQAHEMLNIMEGFMLEGIDQAQVWPLIQNTPNALSIGQDYSGMTVPGEMFSMMSDTLPGKMALDFSLTDRETEYSEDGMDVHAFAGEGELTFYVVSTSHTEGLSTKVDINNLVESYGSVDTLQLGVEDDINPGSTKSIAELENVPEDEIIKDGVLSIDLAPGEILEITFRDVVPTDEFKDVFDAANAGEVFMDGEDIPDEDPGTQDPVTSDDAPGETPHVDPTTGLPTIDIKDTPMDTQEDDDDSSEGDDGGIGDMAWALMLLPILALAGMAV